jgi:hypothetical protein
MRRAGRIVLRACAAILVLDVVVSVAWGTFGSEPEYTCDAPCGTNPSSMRVSPSQSWSC